MIWQYAHNNNLIKILMIKSSSLWNVTENKRLDFIKHNSYDEWSTFFRYEMVETVWDFSLYGACAGNHLDLVKFLVDNSYVDINTGLINSCKNNRQNIVNFLIEIGANEWNKCLLSACSMKNKSLMKLLIGKGATECKWCGKSIKEHL